MTDMRLCARNTIVLLALVSTPVLAQPGTTTSVTGRTRELVCRGKAGLPLRVYEDPSARDPSGKYVMMLFEYTTPAAPPGTDYIGLKPGECSWNQLGWKDVPKEPGRVYFDVLREAQPWSKLETRAMDTTARAGAFFPDPISLPRYLGDPQHYWVFYVDDTSNYSLSFGAWKETGTPTFVTISGPVGPVMSPNDPKELRCRGGPSGLAFTRGGSAGTNEVNMTLAYRVSANPPGQTGKGLDPGSCAWVNRTGLAREPGRVDFTTAGNAQLKQIQSGGTVDRTATAAERYPDANTIPVYLGDATRYWNFTVTVGSPNTARSHAAWKPTILDIITSKGPTEQPTSIGSPDRSGRLRDASPVLSASKPGLIFREVVRKPNEYVIKFSARAGAKPLVYYGTSPPVFSNNSGLWGIPGGTTLAVTQTSVRGFAAEYTSAPMRGLPHGSKYYFAIGLPDYGGTKPESYRGEFMTMTQSVTVRFIQVRILNDSDKSGAGEVGFRFNTALAPKYDAGCSSCVQSFTNRSWETGNSYPLANTFRFANTTDRLRLWVTGWDADSDDPYWINNAPAPGLRYTGTGGSDSYREWNMVKAEFNLAANPDRTSYSQGFRLRSIDGFTFMFEIVGELEVSRQ